MKILKHTWQFILGIITAIIAGVLFSKKDGGKEASYKLKDKHEPKLNELENDLTKLKEKSKHIKEVVIEPVKDLETDEVTEYWKKELKDD